MRTRGRLTIYFDVDHEDTSFDPGKKIDALFEEEHRAQLQGREPDPGADRYFYGLTLRLPGNFIVTGHETAAGYSDQDPGVVPGPIPKFRVIKGDAT